jgi:archaellum component FlaF (FlaF/FlaG flagellin family)
MGAAASVRAIYRDAIQWFRNYVDSELYYADFAQLDKDEDGGVTFVELKRWIDNKISEDKERTGWSIFKSNTQVLSIAHKNSAPKDAPNPGKIVTIAHFRDLLLHLFATSILWSHFENADNWELGGDVGNKQLNLDEFRLACTTLCAAHARETLSEEQIKADFLLLDTNQSNSIGFVEVCNYCCKYVNPAFDPEASELDEGKSMDDEKILVPKFFGENVDMKNIENDKVLHDDLKSGSKIYFSSHSVKEKEDNAIQRLKEHLQNEVEVTEQVTNSYSAMNTSSVAVEVVNNDSETKEVTESELNVVAEVITQENVVEANISTEPLESSPPVDVSS